MSKHLPQHGHGLCKQPGAHRRSLWRNCYLTHPQCIRLGVEIYDLDLLNSKTESSEQTIRSKIHRKKLFLSLDSFFFLFFFSVSLLHYIFGVWITFLCLFIFCFFLLFLLFPMILFLLFSFQFLLLIFNFLFLYIIPFSPFLYSLSHLLFFCYS